jgi:Uma2 family endonuclease
MAVQIPEERYTRADLALMPDDGRRHELIDGELIVSAAPGRVHQRAVMRLARLLEDVCTPQFEVLIAPFASGLAEDTELQPDVLVARRDQLTEKELPGPPALAVEVLSPSTRMTDLNRKRRRFERAATPSYWVVDPVARPEEALVIAWELDARGRYEQVAQVIGEDAFDATRPYPVSVIPADLVP